MSRPGEGPRQGIAGNGEGDGRPYHEFYVCSLCSRADA